MRSGRATVVALVQQLHCIKKKLEFQKRAPDLSRHLFKAEELYKPVGKKYLSHHKKEKARSEATIVKNICSLRHTPGLLSPRGVARHTLEAAILG